MAITAQNTSAREEDSVKVLYEDVTVAEEYINQRFSHAWGRLLHRKQVAAVNHILATERIDHLLEIAPGPARLSAELKGVRRGMMVDNSEAMLAVAKRRLDAAGVSHLWDVQVGNAFELEKLEKRFSFIFTFRFIRHFGPEDRARLYRSIALCLQPGGFLMFDVVNEVVREKIDSRSPSRPQGELDVFDETYSHASFVQEMNKYGFEVIQFVPTIKHFFLQSWISDRLGFRFPKLSFASVAGLESIPSRAPLEWIALCQKIK
jgi:SAM-dependent methyltransferase